MVPRGCRGPPRPAGRGCCFSGRERIARRGYFGSPRQDLNIAVENANKRLARGQERSDSSSLSIRSRGKSQRRAERCWEGRAGTGAGVGVALPARGSQALGCSVPRPRRPSSTAGRMPGAGVWQSARWPGWEAAWAAGLGLVTAPNLTRGTRDARIMQFGVQSEQAGGNQKRSYF